MSQLRAWPLVGGLITLTGITGLIGYARSRSKTRRPTGAQLMKMSDSEFASYIGRTGLKTVSTARLTAPGGSTD